MAGPNRWMGDRAVYCARLESVCALTGTRGSNPRPSAIQLLVRLSAILLGLATPLLAQDTNALDNSSLEQAKRQFESGHANEAIATLDSFEQRNGARLTFMPFFVRAAIIGLQQFPIVNASTEGDNIRYHRNVNVGIAVALDWGLIVPVLKNADELNFLGL